MQLKIPLLLSQQDERWAAIILGYNASGSIYNIKLYGCLISCLGMYVGKNPDEVNTILKANSGFSKDSGNFIWAKSTVLGLNQTYLSPRYTGLVTDQGIAKVKELLDQKLPLICEIDFNPVTEKEEPHFVLLIGYENDKIYAADPWSGTIIDLDVYGGAKRAIIQFRAYDKKLEENDGELEACYKDRNKFWQERDQAQNDLKELEGKYTLLLGERDRLKEERNQCLLDNSNFTEATKKVIEGQKKQIDDLTAKNNQQQDIIDDLRDDLNATDDTKQKKIIELTKINEGLKSEKLELQKQIANAPKFVEVLKLWGNLAVITYTTKVKAPENGANEQ